VPKQYTSIGNKDMTKEQLKRLINLLNHQTTATSRMVEMARKHAEGGNGGFDRESFRTLEPRLTELHSEIRTLLGEVQQ